MDRRKQVSLAMIGAGILLINAPRFVHTPARDSPDAAGDFMAAAVHLGVAASAIIGILLIIVGILRFVRKPR